MFTIERGTFFSYFKLTTPADSGKPKKGGSQIYKAPAWWDLRSVDVRNLTSGSGEAKKNEKIKNKKSQHTSPPFNFQGFTV